MFKPQSSNQYLKIADYGLLSLRLLEHGLDLQLKKCTEVVLPGILLKYYTSFFVVVQIILSPFIPMSWYLYIYCIFCLYNVVMVGVVSGLENR